MAPPTLTQLLDPNYDITGLSKSADATTYLFKILQQLVISNNTITTVYESRIAELENTVKDQSQVISDLESRLVKTEQYSSRRTAIITNLPEKNNENLEKEFTQMINDSKILLQKFDIKDISHIHRNRRKVNSSKPTSITVVFTRSIDKDRLFQKDAKTTLSTKFKIKLHHHMCGSLIAEQKKMEAVNNVDWVSYMGHTSNFSVKMKEGAYFKKVQHTTDLLSRL